MRGREDHWREEDEAFYQRLRDRERSALLVRVLRDGPAESNERAQSSERAQGLSALLREDSLGDEAFTRAAAGDSKALRALVFCSTYAGKRPGLLHHLALLHGQAAARRSGEAAAGHVLHALGAWVALRAEGHYLPRLAKEVAPELDEGARDVAIRAAVFAPLESFRERALSDAADRGPEAHAGLRLHARRGELSALVGGLVDGEAQDIELELRSLGGEITDAALEPIERALDDAATAQMGTLQVDLLAKLASLGAWAGGSREVDHRFLERAMPIAWTLYKGSDKSLVARFVATTRECVDRCATRVLMDPSELAQASRVAQMLVFRAESARTLSEQVTAIEKALEVCPTHRNGRLVGADIFAFRGLERLRGAGPLSGSSPADAAMEDAKRARALWPRCKRLTRLLDELARVGRFLPKEDA